MSVKNSNKVGIIAAVCACGFKFYWYAIGDKENKNKFIGPPTPQKILYQYDIEHGGRCPICKRVISRRPTAIYFMSKREFDQKYIVGTYRIYNRHSLVEEYMEKSITRGVGVDETPAGDVLPGQDIADSEQA